MPGWTPPSQFVDANTVAATPHDTAWDSLAALLNSIPGDPTTGLDEANIRYMASVVPLNFSLDGAVVAGVQKHIYTFPYVLYPIQVSAALGAVVVGDTIAFNIVWSTDGFAVVHNGILTGASTLTGGDTVATPYTGGQLSALAIPANAQIRLVLSGGAGAPADFSCLLLCKTFHRTLDLNI